MTLNQSSGRLLKEKTLKLLQEFVKHLCVEYDYNDFKMIMEILKQAIDDIHEERKEEVMKAGMCPHDKMVNVTTMGDTMHKEMCVRCHMLFERPVEPVETGADSRMVGRLEERKEK